MESQIILKQYRISRQYDGSPLELSRAGGAISYKGKDSRTGAPVLVTLLPVSSVDPDKRESFEENSRLALQLDHPNVAKLVAVGREEEDFVFVSISPDGETVESWIGANGPLPPDAVLRVGLQVLSALTAIKALELSHPGIDPSNLIMVPGQTWEEGWPFVKLIDLAPPGWRRGSVLSEYASPEQIANGTSDFRSEVYSLGATMCFLLTGAFYSAEPRVRQTRRFARPLRKLIAPMLSEDPADRPQDPGALAEQLRACLQVVERRQRLARQIGVPFTAVRPLSARKMRQRAAMAAPIPLIATVAGNSPVVEPGAASALSEPAPGLARPSPATALDEDELPARRHWVSSRNLAYAAIILLLITLGAIFLPAPVAMIMNRDRDKIVGVPTEAPAAAVTNAPASAATMAPSPNAPAQSSSTTVASNQAPATPPPAASVGPTAPLVASNNATPRPEEESTDAQAEPEPPAKGPNYPPTLWDKASGQRRPLQVQRVDRDNNQTSANESEQANESKSAEADESDQRKPAKGQSRAASRALRHPGSRVANGSRDDNNGDEEQSTSSRHSPGGNWGRARYIGTTHDGYLVLRLPSGETIAVPPWRAQLTGRSHSQRRVYSPPSQPFSPSGD